MTTINVESKKSFPLFRLLPNMVTLLSICIGLYAIRHAMQGNFQVAVGFVMLAGFMDALDGRLARYLNSSSDFGAQLDSLADYSNFGVVPGFITYFWINSFSDVIAFDWGLVMLFALCNAIRLARFNVESGKDSNAVLEKYFFKGIPAPCGAAMSMLPIILYFEFGEGFYYDPSLVIVYSSTIALLMASRIPTISIKKIPIRNEFVYLTLMVLGVIIIGLLIKPWYTLAMIGTVYAFSIPVTIFYYMKISGKKTK